MRDCPEDFGKLVAFKPSLEVMMARREELQFEFQARMLASQHSTALSNYSTLWKSILPWILLNMHPPPEDPRQVDVAPNDGDAEDLPVARRLPQRESRTRGEEIRRVWTSELTDTSMD